MPNEYCDAVGRLLGVVGDIDSFDLKRGTRSDLLRELTRTISRQTGVRELEVVIADTPDAAFVPDPSTDVVLVRAAGGGPEVVPRGGGWWAGRVTKPPAVGGIPHFQMLDRPDGKFDLIVPLKFATCFGAARAVLPADARVYSDLWATGLVSVFQTLSTRRHEALREERQAFFTALTGVSVGNPDETFKLVCREWHKLGRADFTWLWLWNPYTRRFEPAGEEGESPGDFELGPQSASMYAIKTQQTVVVQGDASKWVRTHDRVEYRVVEGERVLPKYGIRAMVVVPFQYPVPPAGSPTPAEPTVSGTVVLHYRDPAAAPPQRKDSLVLMGRFTAQTIVNTFRDEQRRLLVEFTGLAQTHLTRVAKRPAVIQAEYLKDLIQLIQRQVGFKTVSIFYRRQFEDAVQCVASSGLARTTGERIADDRLAEVVYQKNEGRTGKCYATGKVLFFDPKTDIDRPAPLSLDLDAKTGLEVKGLVFMPFTESRPGAAFPPVLGVIRCGQYGKATRIPSTTIHPIQVQNLQYIAQQVGPMLQILERDILWGRRVSTIKHDLFTQMNMIRDAVDRLTQDLGNGRQPREYDLKNLGVARVQGTNLIAQLDPDPENNKDFDPVLTMIEGDILARVVNMLRHYASSERGMTIEYDLSAIPRMQLDRALVERAIYNLIVNAVKYGEPETTIRVSDRTARGGYMLDVTNEGIGIDEADAKLLGEPNFRAAKTKHLAQGAGLGVYIARTAMRKHGGDLFITSRRNPTTVSLFFPRSLAR